MAGFFEALKLLLPGVFADRGHWRERALNAEARLSELISQMDATFSRERAEWRSEQAELMGRLGGDYPLPLPPSDDGRTGRDVSSGPRSHPIARAFAEAKEREAKIPDAVVEAAVDEILKMNAVVNSHNHDRGQ